ncbi:MAG TPA: class I SAM-dependent methyltransferase [Candidatus Acidoferrales bacterium]|nr:class I SAM-dependent methyltransferase [Candidatus Acidoferrales bacterium]
MQHDKIKINLSAVSETLLASLWARAKISREHNSLLNDVKAIELVEHIDYDFSTIQKAFRVNLVGTLTNTVRVRQFDDKIKEYIAEHPKASVVNIGAGLDTHFYRVDNGSIHWYDLDLPAVIDIRRKLLPEPDRVTYIAKSFLDRSWCKDVKQNENGVFIIAGGVLMYFEEVQVKQFFSLLADNFPGSEIVFDGLSKLTAFFDSFKIRRTGIKGIRIKWGIKDACKMTQWDDRIKVIEQFPCFHSIPRDLAWDKSIKRFMDAVDKNRLINIFHLLV